MLQKKTQKYNPNWSEILGYLYRILTIGGSGSGKINAVRNLINHEPDIAKIFYMLKIHMKQNINY